MNDSLSVYQKYYYKNRKKMILRNIKTRCENPKHNSYKNYGGKGIKANIRLEEIEYLGERDSAEKMKRPSVDRIDSNADYILGNCRFIEFSKNVARSNKSRFEYSVFWRLYRKNKKCKSCSITKEMSEYYKNKSSKDGHTFYCKECENKRHSIRRPRKTV